MKKTLVFGYGNPGRQDDGLGILLAEKVKKWSETEAVKNLYTDYNYQLNIEDAETIANYDYIIFADATRENIKQYDFTTVDPSEARVEFTMHAVSPAYILYLCNNLFHKYPEAKLLHIKGVQWEFKEGLSDEANKNLNASFTFIKKQILLKYRYYTQ